MQKVTINHIYSDFFWYFIGSVIPALFSFLKLSIYTRYFTPADYGIFTLINTTFNYLSIGLYTWISACIWRYYYENKQNHTLDNFFYHTIFLFILSSIILIITSVAWAFFSSSTIVIKLVIFSSLQLFTAQIIQFTLIVIRLENRAMLYNIINLLQVAISFGLLIVYTFYLKQGIEAFVTSQLSVNCMIIVFLIGYFSKKINFLYKKVKLSKSYLKVLAKYGTISLYTNFGLLIISLSDRYVIALFGSLSEVGIYNQVNLIGQFCIYQVIQVFFNTINPSMIKILTINKFNNEIKYYVELFSYLFVPLAVFLSLFSEQIATVLLGEAFRSGRSILPFVMFGSLWYGYSMFGELALKFSNQYKSIFKTITITIAFCIGFNLILVPIGGYKMAAIVTFGSYFILAIAYSKYTKLGLNLRYILSKQLGMLLTIALLVLIDFTMRYMLKWELNITGTIIEGLIFCVVYIVLMHKKIIKIISEMKYI